MQFSFTTMVKSLFLVTIISFLLLEVEAQPTVDESLSREATTRDEAIIYFIAKGFSDVKKLLGSHQQTRSALDSSSLSSCIPLLVQQNIDGSDFFNRSWAEFKVGFNDTRGNNWLGNDLLHQLTSSGRYKLRFDLQLRANLSWYYAEYLTFLVGNEASNYKVTVSGYSGNIGDAFTAEDGMMFTTYDRDNDRRSGDNCAAYSGGGFWYNACHRAGVNNARGYGQRFRWYTHDHQNLALQSTRMWLMC